MQRLYIFAKPFLSIACLVLILGTGAAFAQTRTADGIGLFGDGSDGDVTITKTKSTFLTRDMYYNNLTIESGQTLNPNGFRVFVSGTLTLEDGARISRDGNDATAVINPVSHEVSGEAGAALRAGTLGGSGGGPS